MRNGYSIFGIRIDFSIAFRSGLVSLPTPFPQKNTEMDGAPAELRVLVQAEVFDSQLEQASELLGAGYKSAGAVIAGVVLETALKDMCNKRNIPPGKLDKMNADLAKAGEYNLLVQKQITALAQIRNDAAHGQNDNFDERNVSSMIENVRRFVTEHLSSN
jgi:hypothetical protein